MRASGAWLPELPSLLRRRRMTAPAPDFRSWSIGALRRFLHQRGASTAGSVERAALEELAEQAAAGDPATVPVSAAAAAAVRHAPQGGIHPRALSQRLCCVLFGSRTQALGASLLL